MPEDREVDLKNNLYLPVISKKYESRPQTPEMAKMVNKEMNRKKL